MKKKKYSNGENKNYSLKNDGDYWLNLFPKYLEKFNCLNNWRFDKVLIEHDTNIVRKIEVYNYFNRDDLDKIINFLKTKQFKYYTKDTFWTNVFPDLFYILLSKENHYTNWKWKKLELDDLPRYYYYIEWSKVLNHRKRPVYIKIYRNISCNKNFSKLEISYYYHRKNYNIFFLDWINWLKGICEIINKLENKIDFIGFKEDFSMKIPFRLFFNKLLLNKTKSNKCYKSKILKMFTWKTE